MRKIYAILVVILMFGTVSDVWSQCTHTIRLTDTYGDGWNGGTVSVSVNGTPVLNNITLPSGYGPLDFTFSATAGQTIRVYRTAAGSWPGEMRIQVLNSIGGTVIALVQPVDGTATTGGTTGTASCPPPGVSCTHTIRLTDTYGDGWNGGTVSVSVNGTPVLNNITLPSGYGPLDFTFSATAGQTIRVYRTAAGSWPGEMRIQVLNSIGGTVIALVQPVDGTATTGGTTGTASCPAPPTPPANDLVCSATAISCGATIAGTTVNATNSGTGENQTCGTAQTQPGVWYTVVGNGQTMTASLCGTVWDSKMSVFSGPNCSSLTCVGGIDDNGPACGGTPASYAWPSTPGVNYYILVHGFASTSAFNISLTCVAPPTPPANDNCANAEAISISCPGSPIVYNGNTLNATEDAMADPSCDPGTIRDVWYTFNSGNFNSVDLTVTLGTASWLGGEVHTSCGNPAPGLTIGGNAGNCDFNLNSPAPTTITGLQSNTTYRLRLFSNVDWDIPGTFTFTLVSSTNNTITLTSGSDNQTVCANNAITSIVYATNGATGATFSNLPTGVTGSWSNNVATISGTPTQLGSFNYTVNLTGGCGVVSTSGTITVNSYGQDGALAPTTPTTVCLGSPITVSASGGVGSPRYWVQSPAGGPSWNVLENQASNAPSNGFTFTPGTPGTYRIHSRWQTACGFCWDLPGHDWNTNNNCPLNAYVDFVVEAPHTANEGGVMAPICQSGTSAPMGGSVGGGATGGTWSGGAGSWTNANDPANATYTAGAGESGSITLILTTSGGVCAPTSVSKTITVNENPTANAGGAMAPICQDGSSAPMGGSVGGGATGGTWSGGTGTWANANDPANAVYTPGTGEIGTITVTLTTSGGSCGTTFVTKNLTIDEISTPASSINNLNPSICYGGSMQLDVVGGALASGAQWEWFESTCGSTVIGTGASISVTPTGNTTYFVRATSANVCEPSACTNIAVTMPTASTNIAVNGDVATCVVNANNWIHFYNVDGRLIASVNSAGQDLGNVTATSLVAPSPYVMTSCTQPWDPSWFNAALARSFIITPTTQPTNPVSVRLYILDSEFSDYQTAALGTSGNLNDDVLTITDMDMTKHSGPSEDGNPLNNCGVGSTIYVPQSGSGLTSAVMGGFSGSYYIEYSISSFSEMFPMNSSNSPLPVSLTSFNANCDEDKVNITWTTASEFNASHYSLQTSRDGQTWTEVAQIEAAGTTSQTTNYFYQDQKFAGVSYYRLVQVDLDGASEIYGPISVDCEINESSMTVYPNPTDADFTVLIQTNESFENATIELVDLSGRSVEVKEMNILPGSTQVRFETNGIMPGTYIVRIKGENDKFTPIRVVVL